MKMKCNSLMTHGSIDIAIRNRHGGLDPPGACALMACTDGLYTAQEGLGHTELTKTEV